jgi:DNA polymerase III alpha subunit
VNYPLEFWTTSLQFAKENEVPYRLSELKKTGVEIEIRPPDINFSEQNFTCDSEKQRIFFSLTKIKGVGDVAVKNIIATRESGGKFYSFREFLSRIPSKVNKTVVKCLIISGAFDLIENIEHPRDRKNLLFEYLTSKGEDLPYEYQVKESKTNAFWILEQKKLTGFGEVDYMGMIVDNIPNKRIAKLFVNDSDFQEVKLKSEVAIAGKLIYFKDKAIKNGTMCTVNIDCNNTIIPVLLWPDAYENIGEDISQLKGCTVVINGVIEKDKFKNERKLISTNRTKLYIISMK